MIYLIAGVPRAGKSTLRQKLQRELGIGGMSTDFIRDALMETVDEFKKCRNMEDLERSPMFWSYFQNIVTKQSKDIEAYVIEGTNFLPQDIATFDSKYVRSVVLGYPSLAPQVLFQRIRATDGPRADWTIDLSDEDLRCSTERWARDAAWYQAECATYRLDFVDTGAHFQEGIDKAFAILTR